MFETIVIVSLIIGFVLVTVFSLTGMLLTRHRDQSNGKSREIAESIAKIDQAADAALSEINKTAALVSDEINEKYQSMLFLYNLVDEKKKDVLALAEAPLPSAPAASANDTQASAPPPTDKKAKKSLNPKHDEIIQLSEVGFAPAEIAKELNMGQGEVRLILDLAKMK